MLSSNLYARPGFLLRRAHQISAALFEDECRSLELTPAQYGVLTVLQIRPGLDQTSLARAMGFDKVTVMHILRGLEGRGLVCRSVKPSNRRTRSVALSMEGQALLAKAQVLAEQAYEKLMSPLHPEDRQQLITLLQTLTTQLEASARAPFIPLMQEEGPIDTI